MHDMKEVLGVVTEALEKLKTNAPSFQENIPVIYLDSIGDNLNQWQARDPTHPPSGLRLSAMRRQLGEYCSWQEGEQASQPASALGWARSCRARHPSHSLLQPLSPPAGCAIPQPPVDAGNDPL